MVCVLSDFFLQMVLFVTVLSIDIRRMEVFTSCLSFNLVCKRLLFTTAIRLLSALAYLWGDFVSIFYKGDLVLQTY